MLDDVTEIETPVAQPMRRASASSKAIKYLEAAGTTAIFVTEIDGVATIRSGSKTAADATTIFWITKPAAIGVARRARRVAGENPNAGTAEAALHGCDPNHDPEELLSKEEPILRLFSLDIQLLFFLFVHLLGGRILIRRAGCLCTRRGRGRAR